jgi:hypothetical protein
MTASYLQGPLRRALAHGLACGGAPASVGAFRAVAQIRRASTLRPPIFSTAITMAICVTASLIAALARLAGVVAVLHRPQGGATWMRIDLRYLRYIDRCCTKAIREQSPEVRPLDPIGIPVRPFHLGWRRSAVGLKIGHNLAVQALLWIFVARGFIEKEKGLSIQ